MQHPEDNKCTNARETVTRCQRRKQAGKRNASSHFYGSNQYAPHTFAECGYEEK